MKRSPRRGEFVSTSKPYQIGKFAGAHSGLVDLALFHNVKRPEQRQTLPISQLRYATLSEHTRVYCLDEAGRRWLVGRVTGSQQNSGGDLLYHVNFPALQQSPWLTQQALYVRCIGADSDPSEILQTAEGLESQFVHDRRLAALETFVYLRSAIHGLSGLLSAAIALLPHQVDVVRRVLEDPIQRYLLADEVGLGKTVEAGVIIRQFLLDSPLGNVVVLAPRELVHQWEQELWEKFGIGDFPDRVTVRPFQDLNLVEIGSCQLLVVDEAHHLVSADGSAAAATSISAR